MLNNTYYDPTPELSADTWQTTIVGDFPHPGRMAVLEPGTHFTQRMKILHQSKHRDGLLTDITLRFVYGIGILMILMPAIQGWPAELFAEREITIAIVQPPKREPTRSRQGISHDTEKFFFASEYHCMIVLKDYIKTLKAPSDSGEQVKIDLIVTIEQTLPTFPGQFNIFRLH